MSARAYPCKFNLVCKRNRSFTPLITVPIKIRGIDGLLKIIERLGRCKHGRGLVFVTCLRITAKEIGWEKPLSDRSFNVKLSWLNREVDV
jgi:hypothetical protein